MADDSPSATSESMAFCARPAEGEAAAACSSVRCSADKLDPDWPAQLAALRGRCEGLEAQLSAARASTASAAETSSGATTSGQQDRRQLAVARLVAGAVGRAAGREEARLHAAEVEALLRARVARLERMEAAVAARRAGEASVPVDWRRRAAGVALAAGCASVGAFAVYLAVNWTSGSPVPVVAALSSRRSAPAAFDISPTSPGTSGPARRALCAPSKLACAAEHQVPLFLCV
ncbi:hypothetical protein WJX81_003649 [Elliptochloris bilobata]|uniref:Uncharacterized protein n=1 Tax=Elliptochloris bilobata TaxID=381761 RepID=A0AAW1SLJ0_9CHLO